MDFFVVASAKLAGGLDDYHLGSFKAVDLSFSTRLHGGFNTCSFSFSDAGDRLVWLYTVLPAAHLVVYDAYGWRCFEGRVWSVALGDGKISIDAVGYYIMGKYKLVPTALWTSPNTTVYQVVYDCVQLVSDWDHSQANLEVSNFKVGSLESEENEKVSDLIERVLKFGYREDDLRPVYFALWEHRLPYLFPEPRFGNGEMPTWLITTASLSGEYSLTSDVGDLYNRVYVRYDDPAEDSVGPTLYPTPADDEVSQERYDMITEGVLDAGQYGLDLAIDLRDLAAEKYSNPRQVLSFSVGGYVTTGYNEPQGSYRIRAGDTVQVVNTDFNVLALPGSDNIPGAGSTGFVVATEYSAESNTNKLTIGTGDALLDYLLSRLGLSGGLS
jgi:hypothetical protein